MDNTDDIKQLLTSAAMEETSAAFTQNVMGRIEALNSHAAYQPLVSKKIRRAFIGTFVMLALVIVVVSIYTLRGYISVSLPLITTHDFFNITFSIIGFWVLMGINYLVTNSKYNHLIH